MPRGFDPDTMRRPPQPAIHAPKHKYDCANCKFNWNCGPLCGCSLYELPDAPRSLAWAVKVAQQEWRAKRHVIEAIAELQSCAKRGRVAAGDATIIMDSEIEAVIAKGKVER